MKITMYTDGSSRGNPGPGGWGAIIITDDEVIELGGGEKLTTNNRMELMGAIEGLGHVNGGQQITDNRQQEDLGLMSVEVCTDSEYVKKGMTEWIEGWIKKGWKTSTKKPVLNQDLWEQLYKEEKRLKDAGVKVIWSYVPGHAGVPLNERADVIATSYADEEIEKGASNLQLYRGSKEEYSHLYE
jgi:ribonuclease HI